MRLGKKNLVCFRVSADTPAFQVYSILTCFFCILTCSTQSCTSSDWGAQFCSVFYTTDRMQY